MSQKRVIGLLVVVLLSFSIVIAEEDTCSGFWGSLNCVLWGDPSLRENLAGEAFQRNLVVGDDV